MFFGSFNHTLDEKNRLVIPSKMRENLGSKLYIMKGFEGALSIYQESEFQKLVEQLSALPFNKQSSRDFIRIQLGSVSELEIDKANRVQLPTAILNKYKFGKEVVVLGVLDHIEVWDKEVFEEYSYKKEKEFEINAENLWDKE